MTRFTTLLLGVALVALALAPAAGASSVAYIAGDGNVHIVSPDGSRDKQLTTDATTDSKYRSPSQIDDGRVVALRRASGTSSFAMFLDRNDGHTLDSWPLPSSGVSGFAPFTGAEASPEGGVIVYDYRHFDCATNPCSSAQKIAFVAGPGQTNPCLINCHSGFLSPRWVPGTPLAAMVDDHFQGAWVQKKDSAEPVPWFYYENDAGEKITMFGLDARAGWVLATVEAGGTEYLTLERMTGTPPAPTQSQCSVSMPDNARPRLSPDGSMIAWTDPQGVMVAPRPPQGGGLGTQCQLNMKLVAPGGKEPDWGVADVPAAPQTETPNQVEDTQPPKAKLTGPDVAAIGKALSKGLAVGFRCSEACRVSAVASVSKAVAKRLGLGAAKTKVGSGRASLAKAGAGSVRIAFTAKAKQLLDDAASVPVNVGLKLTDRAGNTRTLAKTVTLK